jgi:hypothetical protein
LWKVVTDKYEPDTKKRTLNGGIEHRINWPGFCALLNRFAGEEEKDETKKDKWLSREDRKSWTTSQQWNFTRGQIIPVNLNI